MIARVFLISIAGLLIAGNCVADAIGVPDALSLMIEKVMVSHPILQAQKSLVEASRAGIETARWQYFPTPSVSIQAAGTSGADPGYQGDNRVTTMGLTQPLYTFGRLDAGYQKAQTQAQLAIATQDEARQQLALRVIQGYGDWLSAHRRRMAYASGLQLHVRLEQQVTRRVQEGQAAESDLTLAKGRLATMLADLAASRAQEEVSLARLSQLVGSSQTSEQLAQAIALPFLVRQTLSELTAMVLETSPSAARSRLLAQIQANIVDEAKATAMPEVFARIERQQGNFTVASQAPQNRAFIGVTSRFGAGLSNTSAVAEATYRKAAAESDWDALWRNLQEQVMTDFAVIAQAEARSKNLALATEMASQTLQSWDRQYLSGRKNWQDNMNAARELVQIQVQLADVESTQLVSSRRLALLAGLKP
jgi:adhesin transport system outer membrane protein